MNPDPRPPLVVDVDALVQGSPEPEDDATLYADLLEWWLGFLQPTIERQQGSSRIWCPSWWLHPEAVCVLEALWRAWEAARVAEEPDATLTWWERTHPMLATLMSRDDGPFAACARDGHRDSDLQLPHETPPADYFGIGETRP
jgi:Domain of unknown function (DUF4913)